MLSKKFGAGFLAAAMAFSVVTAPVNTDAAAKPKLSYTKTATAGKSTSIKIKNVKKGYYYKVTKTSGSVTTTPKVKKATKIKGKTATIKAVSKKAGTYKVTVQVYKNKKAKTKVGKAITATVKVTAPTTATTATTEAVATDLKLEGASIVVGAKTKLVATVTPANAKVTFESKDPDIATVDAEGNVTGVKAGTAVITATSGTKVATAKVTVSDKNTVKSVEMLNAVQAKVSFGTEMTIDTDHEKGKFTVEGVAAQTLTKLSDTEYLATFASSIEEKKVSVAELTTKDGAKTAEYISDAMGKDTTVPTIESVDATTNNSDLASIKFTLSEAISNTDSKIKTDEIRIDGKNVSKNDADVEVKLNEKTGKYEAEVTLKDKLDTTSTHKLTIYNLVDKASKANKSAETTKEFTAKIDKEAPTVEATAVSDHIIRLTFSKDLGNAKADLENSGKATNFVKVLNDEMADITSNVTIEKVADVDNQVDVVIPAAQVGYTATTTTKSFTILAKDGFTDKVGNSLKGTSKTVSFTKDTTDPTIESISYVKGKKGIESITFTASEELATTSVTDASKVTFIDPTGTVDANFLDNATPTVKGNKVTYTYSDGNEKNVKGAYVVTLANGFAKDKAATANGSTYKKLDVDFGKLDTTTTFPVTKIENKSASTNTFEVTFSTPVNISDAMDAKNYKLNGSDLPKNTDIKVDSSSTKVTITLPAKDSVEETLTNKATLSVSGIKNKSGNLTVEYTVATKLSVVDNTAPTVKSIELVNGALYLTLSETGASIANGSLITISSKVEGAPTDGASLKLTEITTGVNKGKYELSVKDSSADAKLLEAITTKGTKLKFAVGALQDGASSPNATTQIQEFEIQ